MSSAMYIPSGYIGFPIITGAADPEHGIALLMHPCFQECLLECADEVSMRAVREFNAAFLLEQESKASWSALAKTFTRFF